MLVSFYGLLSTSYPDLEPLCVTSRGPSTRCSCETLLPQSPIETLTFTIVLTVRFVLSLTICVLTCINRLRYSRGNEQTQTASAPHPDVIGSSARARSRRRCLRPCFRIWLRICRRIFRLVLPSTRLSAALALAGRLPGLRPWLLPAAHAPRQRPHARACQQQLFRAIPRRTAARRRFHSCARGAPASEPARAQCISCRSVRWLNARHAAQCAR